MKKYQSRLDVAHLLVYELYLKNNGAEKDIGNSVSIKKVIPIKKVVSIKKVFVNFNDI